MTRTEMILSLDSLVHALAYGRARSLPRSVDVDDLVSVAWVGAIQAVDKYDPARAPLPVYARYKILSAINDYLRVLDPLKRDHRRAVAAGDSPELLTFSLDPTPQKDGADRNSKSPLIMIADHRAARSHSALNARITVEKLQARAGLKPRNLAVLNRYMNGETMKDIGGSINVNESRVSQICSQAIEKLRAAA